MFDVINERYENRKPTLFLTNLDVLDSARNRRTTLTA